MGIRGKIQNIFGRNATDEDVVDADYEYMVSLFGDFIVSEALRLSEADYETPAIQELHDAAWDEMLAGGYRRTAHFVNAPAYDVRVRLCRKILQTRIALSVAGE